MDIESKAYRIRSGGTGQAEIIDKGTGRATYVPLSRVPSVHELAMMKESDLNRALARLAHHHVTF